MARALYREWFVHFRFPGHESVPRVPSPLGEIPQGWEVKKIAEFADFTRGFEPGSDAYKKESDIGLVKFLRVGDLSKRDSGLFIDEQLVQGRVLEPHDIAITLDGSVGEVRLGLEGAYSSGIRRVDVKDKSRLGWVFTYQLLRSDASQATIQAHAKGTTIKHAGSAVHALEFVSPPANVIKKFETIAAPMVRQVLSLLEQVENLRRTRDLLLPRVLSGQIDVEAMPA
jgi:type I restriction enzyme S subunit